jgi:hypothetical protein
MRNRSGKRTQFPARGAGLWRSSPTAGVVPRKELKVYLNETAPRWERLRARSSPHGLNNSRPSPAGARPGSTAPLNQGDPPCSFPPWPRRAAGSDRFWLLELRASRTFSLPVATPAFQGMDT